MRRNELALVLVAGCCLSGSVACDGSRPPAAGPSAATANDAPDTSASPASSSKTPTVGAFVTRMEATEAGLPDVGVQIDDVPTSFAALKAPQSGTLLSLGGPPGGTLMFVVRTFSGDEPSPDQVAPLYRKYLEASGALSDPFIAGPNEKIALGGAKRHAQAFITGRAPARANWCVMLVSSPRKADEGLLVLAGVGVPDSEDKPRCSVSLQHELIKPLAKSFAVK